ncbi:MAG: helix-turn-helix domain-containing protein [Kiloniellales bacterium]
MVNDPRKKRTVNYLQQGSASDGTLTYRPLLNMPGLEVCDWRGRSGGPALAAHFHREAQLTVVREGFRWFSIGSETLKLCAGQFVIIPPDVPHQAIGHSEIATRSFDVFLDGLAGIPADPNHIVVGGASIKPTMQLEDTVDVVLERIDSERIELMPTALGGLTTARLIDSVQEGRQKISHVAASAGMSREGFIRLFRRHVGMTPHAYLIAGKVCHARDRLRRGMPPAEAAYDAGFADQSHMGRAFLKLYGTTPGAFRQAWRSRPSHSFQIRSSNHDTF